MSALTDDAAMQADAIVNALDVYLSTFPWPAPTVSDYARHSSNDQATARKRLSLTLAASIRLSEPRRSPLQGSGR